jgi:hypothetical protein
MVLPHDQGPFCVCRRIRKMHRRDRALKKELWIIIMDSKVEMYCRIQATKELHSLSKTYTLLIKDLPFGTNLSKFYDPGLINSSYNNMAQSKNVYVIMTGNEVAKNHIQGTDINPKNLDNPFNCDISKNDKTETELENTNTNPSRKYKQVDDEVMENMQSQLNYSDDTISADHLASIQRLKELFDD